MFNLRVIYNITKQDKIDLKNWFKNNLEKPIPNIVKHRTIIKYKKKQKSSLIIGWGKLLKERKYLFKCNVKKVIILPNDYETALNLLADELKKQKNSAVIWIDTINVLNSDNLLANSEKIKALMQIATKDIYNSTLIFDSAHLYYTKKELPSVHDIKEWFFKLRSNYSNLKVENDLFVISIKL